MNKMHIDIVSDHDALVQTLRETKGGRPEQGESPCVIDRVLRGYIAN